MDSDKSSFPNNSCQFSKNIVNKTNSLFKSYNIKRKLFANKAEHKFYNDDVYCQTWKLKWRATLPIEKVNDKNLTKCLDSVLIPLDGNKQDIAIYLHISLLGVSIQYCNSLESNNLNNIHTEINKRHCINGTIVFSLKNIICLVGREDMHQISYITRDFASFKNSNKDDTITTLKHCYIFHTETKQQVKDIVTCLNNAFRTVASDATLFSHSLTNFIYSENRHSPKERLRDGRHRFKDKLCTKETKNLSPHLIKLKASTNVFEKKNILPVHKVLGNLQQRYRRKLIYQQQFHEKESKLAYHCLSSYKKPISTLLPKHKSFSTKSRIQINGSCDLWLRRLFGSTSSIITKTKKFPNEGMEFLKSVNAKGHQCLNSTKFNNNPQTSSFRHFVTTPNLKRSMSQTTIKKITMLNYFQRMPTCTIMNNQKSSTFRKNEIKHEDRKNYAERSGTQSLHIEQESKNDMLIIEKTLMDETTQELIFDNKLQEWIYPIDEGLMQQLESLAYFCRLNTNKDNIVKRLQNMPEGTFILRISGSRKACITLSVRTKFSFLNNLRQNDFMNDKNYDNDEELEIVHYLIIRNECGFRIKGSKRYFESLPMLITHYTVINDHLPCRLRFTDQNV